jgi:hypothetical protein
MGDYRQALHWMAEVWRRILEMGAISGHEQESENDAIRAAWRAALLPAGQAARRLKHLVRGRYATSRDPLAIPATDQIEIVRGEAALVLAGERLRQGSERQALALFRIARKSGMARPIVAAHLRSLKR